MPCYLLQVAEVGASPVALILAIPALSPWSTNIFNII